MPSTMIKIMILVVILACIGPFFIKGPDGQPLMTIEDWMPDEAVIPDVPTTTKVYKYKDENGNWVFTSEPVEGQDTETMEINSADINTMDEFRAPRRASTTTSSLPATTGTSGMTIPSGLTSVAPEQVEDMMNTVNNLQQTVDQRKEEMDRATGQ